MFVKADVTSAMDMQSAVAECVAVFGRLDIGVLNAGISVESTHDRVYRVHETTEEDWDKTLASKSRRNLWRMNQLVGQMKNANEF